MKWLIFKAKLCRGWVAFEACEVDKEKFITRYLEIK